MATHSSILAWRIPWTEELAGYSPWGRKSWTRLSNKPPPYLNDKKMRLWKLNYHCLFNKNDNFCLLFSLLPPSFHFCVVCCCCCCFWKLLVSRRQLIERPWLGAWDWDHSNTKPSTQNVLGASLWRWGKGRERSMVFHLPCPSALQDLPVCSKKGLSVQRMLLISPLDPAYSTLCF